MPEKEKTAFGVYQRETGSFTSGEHRFVPGQATEVPAAVATQLDPEASPEVPVRFFASADKAAAEVTRLKDKFARKPTNK